MAKYIKWCDDVLPQWRTGRGDQYRTTQGDHSSMLRKQSVMPLNFYTGLNKSRNMHKESDKVMLSNSSGLTSATNISILLTRPRHAIVWLNVDDMLILGSDCDAIINTKMLD